MERVRRALERRYRRDERGAVAVLLAIGLTVVLLVIAAFAVDLGMQRTARRDMQAVADVVALDLARNLDGRTASELAVVMDAEMPRSVARNSGMVGSPPHMEWRLGRLEEGRFIEVGAGEVPSAVKVIAETDVAFAFGPVAGVTDGDAGRSAVALSEGGACFSIGSYAARLDTGSSPILGPLLGALGSNINVSAIDYNGLANVDVKLIDLLGVNAGVGTMEELIRGGRLISLADFYLATAEVLSKQGNAVFAGVLEAMAVGVDDVMLNVGDLVDLGTAGGSGLDADLNLLDLVTAAAAAATGHNALSIPQAGVNLGPLANVGVSLSAIEAPRLGCGRKNKAKAESTQVTVNLAAQAANLNLVLAGTDVTLSGTVKVAKANGLLTDVRCAPAGITVGVSDGLLDVDLKLEVKVYANLLVGKVPVIGGPITIKGQTTTGGQAIKNIVTDGDYEVPETVGSGTGGLPVLTIDTSKLSLIGLPVGILLDPVIKTLVGGLVNPLVQGLDAALLSPLLNNLGLDLSGADIYAHRTPKCDAPKLVG